MKLVYIKGGVHRLLGISLLLVALASCEEDSMERYSEQMQSHTIDMFIEPASPIRLKVENNMSPFYTDSPSGEEQQIGGFSSTANPYTSGLGNLR